MKKKTLVWVIGSIVILIALAFIFTRNSVSSFETIGSFNGEMKVYKSMSCGCCDVYITYFKSKGNPNTHVVNLESLDSIKKQYGIPSEMESCHTVIIGNYFVEGHVPLEAIEKLLQEKPDIKGIAMPGMPSGAPGMLGKKTGDFVVYAVNNDGSYEEFMRI